MLALSYNLSMQWNILGHDWAVEMLTEHIIQSRVRHAYLFTGPQGVGRRTLALCFAQALNCPSPPTPGQACGVCSTCTRIGRMQHPDLAIVQAEQEGGTLRVDQVRELNRGLSLAPYEARYRVAVLLRFEEAHVSASNALLKTLEEPPPQVVMILTAESAESLLPTIVSRCEVLRLRPIPPDILEQGLISRWGVDHDQARLLAHVAGGRPGYALGLHGDAERMELRNTWLEDHYALLTASRVDRFVYARTITEDKNKDNLPGILQVWLSFWRDVMLRAMVTSVPLTNLDWSDKIQNLAEHLQKGAAQDMVSVLERTLYRLDRNVNARLAIEVLMLTLPRI